MWLCSRAALAVVAPTLAFISGIYGKLPKKENGISRKSVIEVEDVAQNTLFFLIAFSLIIILRLHRLTKPSQNGEKGAEAQFQFSPIRQHTAAVCLDGDTSSRSLLVVLYTYLL